VRHLFPLKPLFFHISLNGENISWMLSLSETLLFYVCCVKFDRKMIYASANARIARLMLQRSCGIRTICMSYC
jgi:hypothetical protein